MIKGIIFLFLVLLPTTEANLIINEVMYSPSDGNEWVEIYNNETFPLNLTFFQFSDLQSTDTLEVCPFSNSTLEIQPNEYALITDQDTTLYNILSFNGTKLCVDDNSLGNGLSNSGDSVTIFSTTFNISIDYSNIALTDNGYSLELVEFGNAWKQSLIINGTPGYKNSNVFINISVIDVLEITEFLPDPQGLDNAAIPEGEWIELYNSGSEEINLIGFILKDNNDDKELIITSTNVMNTTIIKPNEYKVIYRNGDGSFTLNNNEFEKVRLYDQKLNLIDEVSYSTSKEAVSWSKLNGLWISSIPSPEEETNEESIDESFIEIEKILDLGSDNKAKFGQIIRVSLNVYKGDTTKNYIKAYIEDSSGNRLSKVSDFNAYNKFIEYDLTLPLQIEPNCNGKSNETRYTLFVEGLDLIEEESIEIEGLTKDLCQKVKTSSTSGSNIILYEIIELPEEINYGNKSNIKIRLMNDDSDDKEVELWSYIYNGPKSLSGEREANKIIAKIPSGSAVTVDLENVLVEEANGDYKLKVNIKEADRKTPEEFTSSIKVNTLNNLVVEKEQVKENIEVKESTNLITGNLVYESNDKKAGRFAIFIFAGIVMLFLIYFIIKK